MKQKKPRFCFIVAKNDSKQNRADLAGDLVGDVGANFYTNVASEQFFSGEVILSETSSKTSEQIFCTNEASEQKNSGEAFQRDANSGAIVAKEIF
jgi:hypothetical protein